MWINVNSASRNKTVRAERDVLQRYNANANNLPAAQADKRTLLAHAEGLEINLQRLRERATQSDQMTTPFFSSCRLPQDASSSQELRQKYVQAMKSADACELYTTDWIQRILSRTGLQFYAGIERNMRFSFTLVIPWQYIRLQNNF